LFSEKKKQTIENLKSIHYLCAIIHYNDAIFFI